MIAKKLGLFGALVLLTTGCGGTVTATRTGPAWPTKSDDCTFEVFTAVPSGYMEIGTLDLQGVAATTIPEFREAAKHDVCTLGGDAVFPRVSGYGFYSHATVLHSVAAPSAPSAAPSAADGCHYDAQCKGERICVSGQCVNPPAK
jgi:hypothetical protein